MDRMGFAPAFATVLLALALCLGCTETFNPDGDAGGGDVVFDNDVPAADITDTDIPDTTGTEIPPVDIPDTPPDTLPDTVAPDQGPFFRVWVTGGASISKNGEVRIIGGIRPENCVPSGDGIHWLIPVFRSGIVANDS